RRQELVRRCGRRPTAQLLGAGSRVLWAWWGTTPGLGAHGAPTRIGRTCPASCHVGALRRSDCLWLPTAGGHTSGGCHQQCHCQSRKSRGLYFPATGDVLFTRLHRARVSSGSNQPRRTTSLTVNPCTNSKIIDTLNG